MKSKQKNMYQSLSKEEKLRVKSKVLLELGQNKFTISEIAKRNNVSKHVINDWITETFVNCKEIGKLRYKHLSKWQKHEVKQRFVRKFSSGKYSVQALATKYKADRRILYKWRNEAFGKGNLRRKLMYKMHQVGIPTRTIAEFYNTHIVAVQRSIREYKQLINQKN